MNSLLQTYAYDLCAFPMSHCLQHMNGPDELLTWLMLESQARTNGFKATYVGRQYSEHWLGKRTERQVPFAVHVEVVANGICCCCTKAQEGRMTMRSQELC